VVRLDIMITDEQLASVAHLSSREAAEVLGVGKTTINRYRSLMESSSEDGEVTVSSEKPSEAPLTTVDADQVLVDHGLVPEAYNRFYEFSTRNSPTLDDPDRIVHSVKVRAVPKKITDRVELDVDELVRRIGQEDYSFVESESTERTLVVTPSDLQIGKTDYNGGTQQTIDRVKASLARIIAIAQQNHYSEIVVAELGDVVENFYNTSSQRETNDLDITSQIRVARRLLLEFIVRLAPLTESLTYVAVPSNHGSVRVGFKAQAGDSSNDWGLEISHQLEDAVRMNASLNHVKFVRPEGLHESVLHVTNGTRLGFVHGHQSRSADKLGEWWKGQSHGRMPVADADILVSGHWHSFRVQHSGDARWVMVSPASDPGSAWFTELTGQSSVSGMLSFTTENGKWGELQIV
jgi:hypothetical protein